MSSRALIKVGLHACLPPLTFAGLRYCLAFMILLWFVAFAFTLWNHSLRTPTAVESSVINNTMLPQIAILAWVFLGEPLNARQIAGLALVTVGTLIVQLWRQTAKGGGRAAHPPSLKEK
ncbi:MAG: EamA family transporter [Anaerolineae bacterium]|nr:EamA family transporter [Anaerolineae bacterium]